MDRRILFAALLVLAGCHEPTGRINSGGGSDLPRASTEGAGGREAPNIITGTPGDDFLQGTTGPDIINGGAGNDIICGGPCDPALIDRVRSYQREGW
jgi:hypothetical protein